MRFSELLEYGGRRLEAAGVEEYVLDARLLLEYCSRKSRTELYLDGATEVESTVLEQFLLLLGRREKREPVAYILGVQEFWSLEFLVSPDVLIPRPETEFLIEQVLKRTTPENLSKGIILDLCCGSGAIGLVLARETGRKILCTDFSRRALELAKKNQQRFGLAGTVTLLQSDLFECFLPAGQFSLIVSNPPYISQVELRNEVQPEVVEFEPNLALDGGPDGLDCFRRICSQLPQMLCPGGQVFMEIGAGQGRSVTDLLLQEADGGSHVRFTEVEVLKDYSGRDRVVHARLQG